MDKVEKKSSKKQFDLRRLGPVLALIVLFVLVTLLNPNFIKINNLLNLLRQVSINAFIAFGMTFVIITGGIDLSVGSVLALSSAIVAYLMMYGMSPILAVLIGVLLGGLLGAINGLIITKGKVVPFIATLSTMTIYRGLTLVLTGGNPLTKFEGGQFFESIGRGYLWKIPVPVLLMLVVFGILYMLLHRTTFGRKTFSVGGNEKAAYIAGINSHRVKLIVYTISGALAATAGLILTSRLNSAQPTAGVAYEMDAIAAVVIGGTSMAGGHGRIIGTLVGALIIGTLNNGLNLLGVSSFYQQIVQGIVILIAVLLDRKEK
ncbi:ABC transporter permease [Facklamia sp. P12945]|uniref:ABC transporter permease n=1 Tax=unclassified Facklamia TaxID=2622293 RepID=UPI003D187562